MHLILLFVNAFLMMLWPLLIAHFFDRAYRRRLDWALLAVGATTFLLSQVGHIPFNWLILQKWELLPALDEPQGLIALALFAGFSAGLFEEVARYIVLRYWARDVRDWGNGVMLGLGHGGFEAFVLGVLVVINGYIMLVSSQGRLDAIMSPEQTVLVSQQLSILTEQPAYMLLLGAAERLMAICLHVSLSLLVLQRFVRGQWVWLPVAILWHALADAVVVLMASRYGALASEGALLIIALFSLGIIWWCYQPAVLAPRTEAVVVTPAITSDAPGPADLSRERLERTRFE